MRRALILLLMLSACVPLYFPPVPGRPRDTVINQIDLGGSAGMRLRGAQLELSLHLSAVPEAGWLAVQWYSPKNLEVASDSLWVTEDDVGFSRTVLLPGELELTAGQWRAVVSSGSTFLRQYALTVPQQSP